jgi:hypothetical protein
MADNGSRNWHFDRHISVAVLIQLLLVGCLVVGSWVNLQRQLVVMQRDVSTLVKSQENLEGKLESLSVKSISYEYRLQALENDSLKARSSADGL